MAKLNYTYTVQQTPSGTDLNVSIVINDATGRQVTSQVHTFDMTRCVALDVVKCVRESIVGALTADLTFTDLPSSFSGEVGLDTTLRNLDLML